MQGNINIPDSTITSELTFRNLVLMNMQQLTNFPYIEKDFDALTDYELLCLVVKFLNDVIANQNEQNASITSMYNAFLALQSYVNTTKDTLEDAFNELDDYVRNYFENLDVQDEINNKLDELVDDGVIEQMINRIVHIVNVQSFGADPTATISSTDAFRQAIASVTTGIIYVPKGHYKITDSISLKSGIAIVGESRDNTYLCPDPTTMGVTSSTLGVKPVFRTSENNVENISLKELSLDCLHWQDDTKVYGILFATDYIVNNFTASKIRGYGQYGLLKFRRGDNYQISDIETDSSQKTLPEPSENAISLIGVNHININNVIVKDSVEVIDFAGCSDVVVDNVIGYSSLADENEAIDIGGSHDISLNNIHTTGFGEGIKLKEETDLVKTYNIYINNSIFTGFGTAAIQLLTNYAMNDYVIENININNCQFKATGTSVGILNVHANNNYGPKDINVTNCIFELQNFAIKTEMMKNLKVDNCVFKGTYNNSCIQHISYASALDITKFGDFTFSNNTFEYTDSTSSYAINVQTLNYVNVINNSFKINGNPIYLLNVSSGNISENNIIKGNQGIVYNSTSHSNLSEYLNINISNNRLRECSQGIRFSADGGSTQSTAIFKGLMIKNNLITNSTGGTTGLLLRARAATLGFDYIDYSGNVILNYTTPVSKDQFTEGSHVADTNITS